MADIIFWSFFLTIIVGLSIPMFGYIGKYLYPEYQTRKYVKKKKIIFTYFAGPIICSCLYTITPFHSLTNFMAWGVIGFVISSIVFRLNINESIQLTSPKKPLSQIQINLLMLTLIIPNLQLFFLFSFTLAGFRIPW